jgi:hypothetical protein
MFRLDENFYFTPDSPLSLCISKPAIQEIQNLYRLLLCDQQTGGNQRLPLVT